MACQVADKSCQRSTDPAPNAPPSFQLQTVLRLEKKKYTDLNRFSLVSGVAC